jgi:hypothetical protein
MEQRYKEGQHKLNLKDGDLWDDTEHNKSASTQTHQEESKGDGKEMTM